MLSPRRIAILAIALAALGAFLAAVVSVFDREQPPTALASPVPTAARAPAEATPEQETARGPELVPLPYVKGYEEASLGRGKVIEVRDGAIGLPADTYVEDGVFRARCSAGPPCPVAPIIVVRRGNSTIALSLPFGTLFLEEVAPGEEGAFDFLKDALARDLLPPQAFPEYRGVVTTTVVGPKTFGSRIRIAGKDVQLPPDAYVNAYEARGLCVIGRGLCPEWPIYGISRGNSTILVSIPSETIIKEDVAPGEEGAFDFLKEALRSPSIRADEPPPPQVGAPGPRPLTVIPGPPLKPTPVPPMPTPTPALVQPPVDRPPMTYEEVKQGREQADREDRARGVVHTAMSGPETAGSRIRIAGKDVQLPPDAYVSAWVVHGICVTGRGPCPEYPTYSISRGSSTISVSVPSGTVITESVAPGEEEAFDFLKEVLPDQAPPPQPKPAGPSPTTPTPRSAPSQPSPPGPTPTPGALPDRPPMSDEEKKQAREEEDRELRAKGFVHTTVVGPETAGSRIRIAGKDVQLPPDAYVSSWILHGLCVEGQLCPETPIYVINRGNSTIAVSIPSGTIIEENVVLGQEGAFDFLKEAPR